MPLEVVRNDITKMECDAIVNAANSTLLGGGGVDGAIHRAAGKGLLLECMKLHGCKVGEAKITKGYNLPSKFVIHTVGPKWRGGDNNEEEKLALCYKNSLKLAKENGCKTVAFPLISSGVYGYPMAGAFKVAVETISSFLMQNDMTVYIVVYNKNAVNVSSKLFSDVAQYIDDNYVDEHFVARSNNICDFEDSVQLQAPMMASESPCFENSKADFSCDLSLEHTTGLDEIFDILDESFSEMLLRKIDELGMTDSECYKKANIDRKLFSKIRSNPEYKPSKPTVIAFCIALELSLDEANEMLLKAGFALSHSNKFDLIIEYFIKHKIYNIFEINEALFEFDQNLI